MHGEPLNEEQAKQYVSTAALLNFITQDRPEIIYAVKEVLRASASPGEEDLRRLKRILRFLRSVPEVTVCIPWEDGGSRGDVLVTVDSDFAGCRETRRSTAGGCIRWGGCLVKTWSTIIPTLCLSSGEAELAAIVRGIAEGEGIRAILKDFGIDCAIKVQSDSSAAVGISSRLGLGKIRHLAVGDLWVQQRLRDGRVKLDKIDGVKNEADLMTKPIDGRRLRELLQLLGVRFGAEADSQEQDG